jgi:catechol 2,3-dioxygenase-like lactoylglutathione lyase family enzyme
MATFAMAMLVCTNLARSRAFYRDILTLKVVTDAFPEWVDFDLGDGKRLGLHPMSGTLSVRSGSLQLGFQIDNLDAFIADARTAGVRVLQDPYEQAHGRVAVIADPDGYVIQVFSPKPVATPAS